MTITTEKILVVALFITIIILTINLLTPNAGRYQFTPIQRNGNTIATLRLDTVTGMITTCTPVDEKNQFTRWICGHGPP